MPLYDNARLFVFLQFFVERLQVGHTLGLRHNFEGSTMLTLEQLQDPSLTSKRGLTSSVMDYLPLNIVSRYAYCIAIVFYCN